MADDDRWDDEHRYEDSHPRERGFTRPPRIGPTGMVAPGWTGSAGTSGRYYEDEGQRAAYGGFGGGEPNYGGGRRPRDHDRERSDTAYARRLQEAPPGDPGYDRMGPRGGRTYSPQEERDIERRVGGPYTDYGEAFGGYGAGGGYTPTPREGISRETRSWDARDAELSRATDPGHRGRGPKGYTRSDERIREDVSDRLTDDALVDASYVEVSVAGGEVTLNGFVDSRTAKRRAEDCAEDVTGVSHVQNNLRVRETPKPGSIGAMTDPRVAAVSDGKDEADAAKDAAR
jgi:hypothetical protein